jgi:hypothetical protein
MEEKAAVGSQLSAIRKPTFLVSLGLTKEAAENSCFGWRSAFNA